jgi:SAM-dependent methyltransferase
MPLHKLPMASSLMNRQWPDIIEKLLTQQIREPLAEAADCDDIPRLTPIDDATSLQVQNQYEENPYPRWNTLAKAKPTIIGEFLFETLGTSPPFWPRNAQGIDILIAGCGTGQHSIDTALRFPKARLLAVDISRASLAYARRKSRAWGLTNIKYAQGDILELAAPGLCFDVIEAVGVLHHLSDPAAGWKLLLSLLRPNGLMFVGLYSEIARRSLTAARKLIAERGYRASCDDIRSCRQDLILRDSMPPFKDFSSTSGCRDLLFHVMEHQFTLPQIGAFLETNNLDFLGFEQLPPDVREQFERQFSESTAIRDLASWHTFEQTHPLTFANMYCFWIQKRESKEQSVSNDA